MNKITNRWMRSGMALLLAVCMVLGAPLMALASTCEYCNSDNAASEVASAVNYTANARKIVDTIVGKLVGNGEYAEAFNAYMTAPSFLKNALKDTVINKIVDALAGKEDLMEKIGMEPTSDNKKILAEEILKVGELYYNTNKSSGAAAADKAAMLEVLRFAVVQMRGASNEEAVATAELYYALNEVYTKEGQTAAEEYYLEKHGVKHSFSNGACTKCGKKVEECHSYVITESKPGSCGEDGYTVYTCSACGDSYTEVIEGGEHAYTKATTKAATCTEKGLYTYTCSNCGDSYTEEIPAIGHAYNKETTKAATCTEKGLNTYTCSNCGNSYTEEVAATGHTYTENVTKAATCTENGEITYTCHCGDTYTEEIPAGHTEQTVAGKAPTCTETGLTDGVSCSVCGEVLTAQTEIPATGHSHEAVVTEPTCTEGGYTTYTCHCGDTYVADETAATGHSHESVVTAPTCTEGGYTTYTCHCGDTYTADETDALGHTFVDGKCSVCGEKDPDYTEPEQPSKPSRPGFGNWFEDLFGDIFGDNDDEEEQPTEPEEPTEPEQPSKPGFGNWFEDLFGDIFGDNDNEEPTEPEQPTEPEEPTEPEQPSKPGRPGFGSIFDKFFGWMK